MRSFRDLEVYSRTLECAVVIASSVRNMAPEFLHNEGMTNCALSIPLWIAEAHSLRFGNKKESIVLLEKAMAGCNKIVVYLEEVMGIYGGMNTQNMGKKEKGKGGNHLKLNADLIDEIIRKYIDTRGKIFRLEKSWQKWDKEDAVRRM